MDLVFSESQIGTLHNRKRPIKPDQRKFNVSKRQRNAGEQYVSYRTGRTVAGKTPPTGAKKCTQHCPFPLCGQLTVGQKQEFYTCFYGTGKSSDQQRTLLLSFMEKKTEGAVRNSYRYYLVIEGRRREICKVTFMDVFQISEKKIQIVQSYLNRGHLTIEEARGKYVRSHVQKLTLKQAIITHIQNQAVEPVHYSGNNIGGYYLPAHLNVTRLFKDFRDSNPTIPGIERKQWLYEETFRESGILLRKPRSDTCRVCDLLHLELLRAPRHQEEAVHQKIDEHHTQADEGYRSMKRDMAESRTNPNLVVKVVDMQQVLFCPTLHHQDVFYLRQYSSYNHCIFDAESSTGNMYFWTESEGKRGVNEIGSCLLHHIRTLYQPLGPNQERNLVVWSDRCRGQNNNFMMITLFLYLINQRYFTKVEQKFLISGHTYMACDRLFGLIEKRKRMSEAMIPDDWVRIIEEAQPSRPFPVIRMTQQHIFDLKKIEDCIPRPPNLQVTSYALLKMSTEDPTAIMTRTDHFPLPGAWMRHLLYSPNQAGPFTRRTLLDFTTATNLNLVRCYNGLLPLSQQKKDNIESMMSFLPLPAQKTFYQNMMNVQ